MLYVITFKEKKTKNAKIVYKSRSFYEALSELENLALDTIIRNEGAKYLEKEKKFYSLSNTIPKKPFPEERGFYAVIERFRSYVFKRNKYSYFQSNLIEKICTFELLFITEPSCVLQIEELERQVNELSRENDKLSLKLDDLIIKYDEEELVKKPFVVKKSEVLQKAAEETAKICSQKIPIEKLPEKQLEEDPQAN